MIKKSVKIRFWAISSAGVHGSKSRISATLVTSGRCRRIPVCTRHCHSCSNCDTVRCDGRDDDDDGGCGKLDKVDRWRYDRLSADSSPVVPAHRHRRRSRRRILIDRPPSSSSQVAGSCRRRSSTVASRRRRQAAETAAGCSVRRPGARLRRRLPRAGVDADDGDESRRRTSRRRTRSAEPVRTTRPTTAAERWTPPPCYRRRPRLVHRSATPPPCPTTTPAVEREPNGSVRRRSAAACALLRR